MKKYKSLIGHKTKRDNYEKSHIYSYDKEKQKRRDKEEKKYQYKLVATSFTPQLRSFNSLAIREREDEDTDKKERTRLLNAGNITDVYVGFEPLFDDGGFKEVENIGHKLGNALVGYKAFLPAIGGKIVYHASIWLGTDEGGIVVEYGCYRGTEGKLRNLGIIAHYFLINDFGLRFYRMPFDQYKRKCKEEHGFLSDPYHYIKLIGKRIRGRTLNQILKDMGGDNIYTESKKYVWSSDVYNLIDHNCQDFAGAFLKEIGAVRKEEGVAFRGFHNFAKTAIPWKILKVLEDNENDTFTTFEKIPFGIGTALTTVKGFGTGIKGVFEKIFK